MTTQKLQREIESLEAEYIGKILLVINPVETTSREYRYIDDCYYLYQQELHDLGLNDNEVHRLANRMLDRMYIYKQESAREEMLDRRAIEVWQLRKQLNYYRTKYGNQ